MNRARLRQIIKEELSRAVNEGMDEVPSWREIEKMPAKSNFRRLFQFAKARRQNPDLVDQVAQHYDENYGGEEGFTGDDLRAAIAKYDADMSSSMGRHYAEKRAQQLRHTEMEPEESEETYEDPESALGSLYSPEMGPSSYSLHKSPKSGRFFGRGRYDTSGT